MTEQEKALAGASTEALLREAARRDDLPNAVSRLGGKALLFQASQPEWHLALPTTADGRAAHVTSTTSRPAAR